MIEQNPHFPERKTTFESLVDLLRTRARLTPDQLAYQFLVDGRCEGDRLSYGELNDHANQIATRLLEVGSPGERALLLYPPGREFLLAFFACQQAGIIAIPLPPPDAARIKRALPRLEAVIRDAQASLVLTTGPIKNLLRSKIRAAEELQELYWVDTESISKDGASSKDQIQISIAPSETDVALLQYTSGSTSTPKGVAISHGNVLSQCESLQRGAGYDENSVACTWMPYHHDYGLIEGLMQPLFVGVPCYFLSPLSFIKRPSCWLEAISRYGVTHSQAPNFAYDLCVRRTSPEKVAALDLSRWRVAAVGAEPIRLSTLRSFYNKFKPSGFQWESFSPAYGLAEATLVVSHTPPGAGPTALRIESEAFANGKFVPTEGLGVHGSTRDAVSCGAPLNEFEVVIVDPVTGHPCDQGEVGEIWLAGPSIASGYWNRPAETEQTFQARITPNDRGPYLRSGDMGCLVDGQLFVTGREKDLLIINGLNHYPQDIELTIEESHQAIRPGYGAAFPIDIEGEEQLAIAYEIQRRYLRGLDTREVFSAIRAAVLSQHDLAVHAIALWNPGAASRTTSGKIQRRAVKNDFLEETADSLETWFARPQENEPDETPPSFHEEDAPAIRDWLIDWVIRRTEIDRGEIRRTTSFADAGVDSVRAAELASDLELWLGRTIDPTILWSHGTIDTLAAHLAGESQVVRDRNSAIADGTTKENADRDRGKKQTTTRDGIAIVGMGCRLPGGIDTPEAFWNLLRSGRDAITGIPDERWDVEQFFDRDPQAPGKMYARHGAFVDGVGKFDPTFFGITPREAEELDPQQRLLLEVAWQSLERAGIPPGSLRGSDTGLFVGMSSDDFATDLRNDIHPSQLDAYKTMGTARSIAAGRIAYTLGLQGPVIQLDTACSSSLVAVHQACQSLLSGDCELAMAGGVNLILSPATMISLCKLKALAVDGRCKAFDDAADGYVRGEGCGIVVLKRISDATRDGDTILATIRAASVNHDGASNGLTAPSGQAQTRLLKKSLDSADIECLEVAYVEAHGTGTELGDPIELTAIDSAYNPARPIDQPLYVGSTKSNIGHLEAAAGIAGLIKVVLMLQHGEIPAQINFETPNRHLAWDQMALSIPTCKIRWPSSQSRRIAAVNSFGFSGTNANVIVEATVPHIEKAERRSADQLPPMHILPLSARSETSLKSLALRYIEHIETNPEQSLEDVCYSAAIGRDHFDHRIAVIASSRQDLLSKLRGFAIDEDGSLVLHGRAESDQQDADANLGFLFTGQGTQYAGMGRQLYETQPYFKQAIDRCSDLLEDDLSQPLTDFLYGTNRNSDDESKTVNTQPALFALQYAILELWRSWGIQPKTVMGHSTGEYAAAQAAGVFTLETGLKLLANRGRLIDQLPSRGKMAVVMSDEAGIRKAAPPGCWEHVSIAALNGSESTVISGPCDKIEAMVATLIANGLDAEILNTSNAGHSATVDPMLDPFHTVAESFSYASPKLTLISTVSGSVAAKDVADAMHWVRHLRAPVRFADGMDSILKTGCRTFVEIGPNPNLLAMGMACARRVRPRPLWLPSITKDRDCWETMLYSLGELYVRGARVDWKGFHRPYDRHRVSLPVYAFDQTELPIHRREQAASQRPLPVCSRLPAPQDVSASLDPIRHGLDEDSRRLTRELDVVAIEFVIRALEKIGIQFLVGNRFSVQRIMDLIPERNLPKVFRVLSRFVERGLLKRHDDHYVVIASVARQDPTLILDRVQRDTGDPACALARRAGSSLAKIWTGEKDPLAVLFPDGKTDEALAFYSRSRILVKYNELAGSALRSAIATMPSDATLRILEVGAGTGGLTQSLLPELPADRSEYVFSDVSPWFLNSATDRLGNYPFLRTELLDIGKPPRTQGFETNSFDMVVAANVLHATPRLHDTLGHVRELLKPGGWLMMLEGSHPPLWGDMVFTLIDGWWDFEDHDLRPDYPLMQKDRWTKVLNATRFNDITCLDDTRHEDESQNVLYLARRSASDIGSAAPPQQQPAPNGIRKEVNRTDESQFGTRRHSAVDDSSDVPSDEVRHPEARDTEQLLSTVRNHAASVMRLQPEDIEFNQPLSELGLDSLMAAELRARLGRTFGRELTLNTLQMRQSTQEIAAYISDNQESDVGGQGGSDTALADLEVDAPRAHLIPLQSHGTKTPLFFVPAGYGDLFAFQEIAHAIGHDQPVYGLQPASAKRVKTFRQMSIYRLVSAYISEIKKAQPEGPYRLSGYSAGAIIAVEVARELQRQGEEISLLVIFDPPSHVPFWLDAFYTANYRFTAATGLTKFVGGLRSRFARRLFHAVMDEGLRTHTSVTREHRPARYPGRITHFRARLSQSSLVSMKPVGRFWRRTACDGVEVHWVPGSHYGMLRGSGASVVVDELRDCLQRADRSQKGNSQMRPKESP